LRPGEPGPGQVCDRQIPGHECDVLNKTPSGKTPHEFPSEQKQRGIAHIYVDWKEIKRHRDTAGYGFTDFVTRERFADWVAAGVLDRPMQVDSEQELYLVK
jgi:hypothetical protein